MSDSIADDVLRNGYERWLRLEEEKAAIGDDLKELFAELKGQGFTPKALRESFRRVRNADNADQQEHDAIVDLYVASLTRARPAHAYEKTLNNYRAYAEEKGRGEDSQEQPETANSSPHHLAPTRGDDAAMALSQDEGATGRQPVDTLRAGRTGSETVTAGETATISEDEPFEPVAFLRQPKPLRPNCLHPDLCASGTRDHCWSCKKQMAADLEQEGA